MSDKPTNENNETVKDEPKQSESNDNEGMHSIPTKIKESRKQK